MVRRTMALIRSWDFLTECTGENGEAQKISDRDIIVDSINNYDPTRPLNNTNKTGRQSLINSLPLFTAASISKRLDRSIH